MEVKQEPNKLLHGSLAQFFKNFLCQIIYEVYAKSPVYKRMALDISMSSNFKIHKANNFDHPPDFFRAWDSKSNLKTVEPPSSDHNIAKKILSRQKKSIKWKKNLQSR
jgi:hypothetical protein